MGSEWVKFKGAQLPAIENPSGWAKKGANATIYEGWHRDGDLAAHSQRIVRVLDEVHPGEQVLGLNVSFDSKSLPNPATMKPADSKLCLSES